MENEKDNKGLTPDQEKELFSNLEFKYSRSKADVWNVLDRLTEERDSMEEEQAREEEKQETEVMEMKQELEQEQAGGEAKATKVIAINWRVMSVAASIVLILSAGLFARFYTKTIHAKPGEFISHTLPDGSEVHLNAATEIKYNPYWWRFNRSVDLNGEAYFVVAKGEKFSVNAVLGTTEVLGTEFNVYARGDDFHVYCESGTVRVTSEMLVADSPDEVILTKGELARVELNQLDESKGRFKRDWRLVEEFEGVEESEVLSWRVGVFHYDAVAVSRVFEDMERQFDIEINYGDQLNGIIEDRIFSGVFTRHGSVEEALKLVCLPMGMSFEKQQDGSFLVEMN